LARLLKRTSVTKTRGAVSPTKLIPPLKRARATNATAKAVRRDGKF